MSIFTEINKAWATLFGFKVESDEASFNDKPIYWNNNAVSNWEDLLSAKPSELKQNAGVAEVPNTKTYDELMTPENFSYGAFDWTNEHGTRVGFSLGAYYLDISAEPQNSITFYSSFHGIRVYTADNWGENYGLGFYGNGEEYYIANAIDGVGSYNPFQDEYYMPNDNYYTCFYMVSLSPTFPEVYTFVSDATDNYFRFYEYLNNGWVLQSSIPPIDDSISWLVCFDDGSQLPNSIEWNDELRSYFVPKVKETETTTILTETTATQAMLGAQIMTHVTVWGMGIGLFCFLTALIKFIGRCFSRR